MNTCKLTSSVRIGVLAPSCMKDIIIAQAKSKKKKNEKKELQNDDSQPPSQRKCCASVMDSLWRGETETVCMYVCMVHHR